MHELCFTLNCPLTPWPIDRSIGKFDFIKSTFGFTIYSSDLTSFAIVSTFSLSHLISHKFDAASDELDLFSHDFDLTYNEFDVTSNDFELKIVRQIEKIKKNPKAKQK